MHSPLGGTARSPLFSPVPDIWSDMWIIDELVSVAGRVLVCERRELGGGEVIIPA